MTARARSNLAPLRGLLVAGTDTNVGKTILSAGLLHWTADHNLELRPFKPVETGCGTGPPADASLLLRSSRLPLPLPLVCPTRLAPPVAPAAATAGLTARQLRRQALALANFQTERPHPRPLLVETAGGLLSPYGRKFTGADLAAALGLPVLLVARNGLGTINHTALAVAELHRRALPLLAIILMTTAPTPARVLRAQRNVELITAATGLRPHVLPHFRQPRPAAIATYLERTGLARTLLEDAGLSTSRAPGLRRAS